jgi:hypothetical protein
MLQAALDPLHHQQRRNVRLGTDRELADAGLREMVLQQTYPVGLGCRCPFVVPTIVGFRLAPENRQPHCSGQENRQLSRVYSGCTLVMGLGRAEPARDGR